MFSSRNGLLSLWKFPPSTRIGKWSESKLWSRLRRIFRKCSSQSEDSKNLSNLEREATSLELDQVNVPHSKGKSIKTLFKNKIWKINHSRCEGTLTRTLWWKSHYIKITTQAPRHTPLTTNSSQLLPKQSPIMGKVWTINTSKSPFKFILYIF